MQQNDPVTEFLELKKLPKTRENYLGALFGGKVPDHIDPEILAGFPEYAKPNEGSLSDAKVRRL